MSELKPITRPLSFNPINSATIGEPIKLQPEFIDNKDISKATVSLSVRTFANAFEDAVATFSAVTLDDGSLAYDVSPDLISYISLLRHRFNSVSAQFRLVKNNEAGLVVAFDPGRRDKEKSIDDTKFRSLIFDSIIEYDESNSDPSLIKQTKLLINASAVCSDLIFVFKTNSSYLAVGARTAINISVTGNNLKIIDNNFFRDIFGKSNYRYLINDFDAITLSNIENHYIGAVLLFPKED